MTKKLRIILLTLLIIICLPPAFSTAETKRLILNYGDTAFSSHHRQPVTLFLKREISRQYPGLDISRWKLKKVVIMAKSKKGKGTAQLRVNKSYSHPVIIPGSPRSYKNSDRFNYDKKTLYNPAGSSNGPWQLKLKGKIKLRKVVLVVDKPKHRDHRNHRDHRDYRDYRDHHYGYPSARPLSHTVVLPARTWGTRLEGERSCGHRSANAKDGWDFPNSICNSSPKATFRNGYRPTRLYIRPDTRSLGRFDRHQHVKQLEVTVTLKDPNPSHRNFTSVTLGVDIGGRTFTKRVALSGKAHNRRSLTESLTISGKWNHTDVMGSRIWILPADNSGDITVNQLQIRVKKVG